MFARECLLLNAPKELWIDLSAIGYKAEYKNFEINLEGKNLVCEHQHWHYTDSTNKPGAYNCKEDVRLFLFIAGYCEDTDYLQLFKTKDNREVVVCKSKKNENPDLIKMTLEEIIERYEK